MNDYPIPIGGPTAEARASQLSSQYSQNIYLEPGRDSQGFAAHDFYGCKAFVARSTTDRGGLYVFQDTIYQVAGSSLFRISAAGVSTSVGAIPGVGRCIFADDGVYLYIVTDGRYYQYNPALGAITDYTPANAPSPNGVAYLNGFFALDGNNGQWTVSDSGDGTTFNGLAIGVANTSSDQLKRIYAFNQLYFLFGTESIEPWYFSGSGNLNFSRLEQGVIQRGTPALYSIADDGNHIYFLGDDRAVYGLRGNSAEPVSTPYISRQIEAFSTVSDAFGFCFYLEGQWFYKLTFPTANKTFLYSSTFNYWVNLSTGLDGGRHLASSYAKCYGKHFVSDYRNGSVYELDRDTFDDAGETRARTRILRPITSEFLGIPGRKSITTSSLSIEMETGTGLATGQGSDPVMICSVSNDGSNTFGPESFVKMGVLGDHYAKPKYDRFTTGRTIVYKITVTDPVYVSIFGGSLKARISGY